MTFFSAISTVLLVLLVSLCFAPGRSIAAQNKVPGNDGAGYVIQMGAYVEQGHAEEMIGALRAKGTEAFLARKDNGMYVVQSQNFKTRGMARNHALKLVASRVVGNYFITTASNKIVSRSSDDGGLLSKPRPVENVQAQKQNSLLFTLLETAPEKLQEVADSILKSNPGDRVALTTLAWHHFRNGRYEEAYKYFSELNRLEPEQIDHVTGMIYALSGMKELEKVMELAPLVNSFFYTRLPGSRE